MLGHRDFEYFISFVTEHSDAGYYRDRRPSFPKSTQIKTQYRLQDSKMAK